MTVENKIILYQDDNEITRVSVRFVDEDLWLTQNQLADIYCTTLFFIMNEYFVSPVSDTSRNGAALQPSGVLFVGETE